jgi:hypothetical protein
VDGQGFLNHVTAACDDDCLGVPVLFFRERADGDRLDVVAPLTAGTDDERATRFVRDALQGTHDRLGFATKTTWAPRAHDAPAPAWLVVIVSRDAEPQVLVKRISIDPAWFLLPVHVQPALATTTAESLVRCLDGGAFPRLRHAQSLEDPPAPAG